MTRPLPVSTLGGTARRIMRDRALHRLVCVVGHDEMDALAIAASAGKYGARTDEIKQCWHTARYPDAVARFARTLDCVWDDEGAWPAIDDVALWLSEGLTHCLGGGIS